MSIRGANRSGFQKGKSYELLHNECEQLQALDESYQKIVIKKFSKNRKSTYPDEQEYFDEGAWFLVTERIRETYYPKYLSPEQEVERANLLNEKQVHLEDESVQRVYEPRLLPVSPYLMSYRELEMAHEAISGLIQENKDDNKLHRSLSPINVILVKERSKKKKGFEIITHKDKKNFNSRGCSNLSQNETLHQLTKRDVFKRSFTGINSFCWE